MIKFADGTTIDTTDFHRMLEIVAERARSLAVPISEIKSKDGVTIKVGNLTPKNGIIAEHSNYVEMIHKGFKIRVWLYKKEKIF